MTSEELRLPWSDNQRLDYLLPCITCRSESISVGVGKCKTCMDSMVREMITNSILKGV